MQSSGAGPQATQRGEGLIVSAQWIKSKAVADCIGGMRGCPCAGIQGKCEHLTVKMIFEDFCHAHISEQSKSVLS